MSFAGCPARDVHALKGAIYHGDGDPGPGGDLGPIITVLGVELPD
jgi:hypothetical protein